MASPNFSALFGLLFFLFFNACSAWRGRQLDRYWIARSPQNVVLPKQGGTFGPSARLDSFTLSYIGCGGFLLQYKGVGLLLDPYFSNASINQILTRPLKPDRFLMDRFFGRELGSTVDSSGKVAAILVSHAHYDHLGDVPYLMDSVLVCPELVMYGSKTAVNLVRSTLVGRDTARQLQQFQPFFPIHSVMPGVPSNLPVSPFFYLPGGRIRFAAIPSNHAGHYQFFGQRKLPFTPGQVDVPPPAPAHFGLKYKEGLNYNFLIDLLDESGRPSFRIFSNAGAACDAGVGLLPEYLLDEKGIDLLLLCGANYNVAYNYPFPLLEQARPRMVWVGHWENFFKPVRKLEKRPETVPNTNIPALLRSLDAFAAKNQFPEQILIEHPQRRQLMFRF